MQPPKLLFRMQLLVMLPMPMMIALALIRYQIAFRCCALSCRQVDRIIFADSGVLLLLMLEVEGDSIGNLRSRGRDLLPGMPEKQPNIIHVSLMRYLNPIALSAKETQDVIAVCEKWTCELRGKRFVPRNMWCGAWLGFYLRNLWLKPP